jgi:hypothetical protein
MKIKEMQEIKSKCERKIKEYKEQEGREFNTPGMLAFYAVQLMMINKKIKEVSDENI